MAGVLAEMRRQRVLEIMSRYRLSCRDVAELLDRHPVTVARWRSDHANTITDHALALLEIAVKLTQGNIRRITAAGLMRPTETMP